MSAKTSSTCFKEHHRVAIEFFSFLFPAGGGINRKEKDFTLCVLCVLSEALIFGISGRLIFFYKSTQIIIKIICG
jgi:hypothetical protein